MNIDNRYIDLIAKHKTFIKVPRWIPSTSPVVIYIFMAVALFGLYKGAWPIFIVGVVLIAASIAGVFVMSRKNTKLQKRFKDMYRRSGRLPDWDWPNGGKR